MPYISGGGGGIQTATLTLTNAQILTLPTTAVQVIAAPRSGVMLVPVGTMVSANTTAAVYTNVTVAPTTALNVSYGNTVPPSASFNIAVLQETNCTIFGAQAKQQFVASVGASDDGNGGLFPPGGHDFSATGIFVSATNTGNFTGGNAANSILVSVAYYLAQVV